MAISLLVKLFFIILVSPTLTKTSANHARIKCLEHEKSLLLDLRNQLVFDSSCSKKLVQWNQTDDCCSWEGVECDGVGPVRSLELYEECISGEFNDSSSLFSLKYLKELDLSYNFLEESDIARQIHKLTNLTSLILNDCYLQGNILEMIFQLPNLQNLDLSNNPSLSGTIPQIPQNNSFRTIVLADTNFSGSLPDSITNLQRLSNIDLSYSKFTGPIPSTLSNLTEIVYVDLSNNFFTGSISSLHFAAFSSVTFMNLSYNSLSGTIPISIFTLPSLQLLDLNHNQFSRQVSEFHNVNISNLGSVDLSSNRLESPLPNSFFNLQRLQVLHLSDNLFNDTLQLENIPSFSKLIDLDLSNNFLSFDATRVPSSSNIFAVLEFLDLSNNKIAGEIPSWIWEIRSLFHLNISSNMLVGLQKPYNIPASTFLYVLDLNSNQLRGELPSSLLQRAEYVDLSNNYFDRFIVDNRNFSDFFISYLSLKNNSLSGSFPSFICKAEIIQFLDLSDNYVSSNISHCPFQNIEVLNLRRNNFTGHIPNFTADCRLQYLDLSNNNFKGEVPLSLANCKVLKVVNVGGNHLEGSFPCMLPLSLHVLVLRSNRFHGEVRCNKSWPNLQITDIAHNNFSGYLDPLRFPGWRQMMRNIVTKLNYKNLGTIVPTNTSGGYYSEEVTLTIKGVERKLVKIWPDFTSIDLSCNNFQGDIPDSIGKLNALYLLNLSHNSFTGTILKSFSNLTWLGALDLSMNQLTGKIPEKLAGLTFLQVMNVSHNQLVGKIPVGSQMQTFPADCFVGNKGLCGLPLNTSCTNTVFYLQNKEMCNQIKTRRLSGIMYLVL